LFFNLREKYRFREFVNGVFEPKRANATTGSGRTNKTKKHNKELHNLYSSSNNITMIESKRIDDLRKYITHMEKMTNNKHIQNFSNKTFMEETAYEA
jgi:ribosomal protein S18